MENYEQKYKEALERARQVHTTNVDENKKSTEYIFPELKESEDERIKREILELVSISGNGNQFEEIKDWLEKQGEQILDNSEKTCKDEQKPTLSEEDKSWFNDIELMALSFSKDNSYRKKFFDWLNSIKNRVQPQPKQEWNKEDSKNLNSVMRIIENSENLNRVFETINSPEYIKKYFIDWLKSIKPHWKPSEEQMEILNMVLTNEAMDDNVSRILRELKEQLEKM